MNRRLAAALVIAPLIAPADAATIIETGPTLGGVPVALDVRDFVGYGPCGSGKSVVGDGCSVVAKNDPTAPHAYGRTATVGAEWIDSQDLGEITWEVRFPEPATSFTFAITDAHDQANSWFTVRSGDAVWQTASRQANGAVNWLTILFDGVVTGADVHFSTRRNDGFGVTAASITPAPIPLPAPILMLLAGIGAIGVAARWRVQS